MSRTAVYPSLEAAGEPSLVRTLLSITTVITWLVGATFAMARPMISEAA